MGSLQPLEQRRTLTIEEAARELGVGRNLAYALAKSGQLPVLRLGRKLLVPRSALERLLTGERHDPIEGDSPDAA